MAKTHTIAAKCDTVNFVLIMEIEDHEDRNVHDTIKAVRNAVQEWACTDDGKQFVKTTHGVIDWGDFVNEIPAAICEKHGFSVKNTFTTDEVVDHDANLLIPWALS